MSALPQLSDEARRVLQVLLSRNVITGGELMRYAGFKSLEEFQAPILELMQNELIQVSGDYNNITMLPFAAFSIRPSATPLLRSIV